MYCLDVQPLLLLIMLTWVAVVEVDDVNNVGWCSY